jgi:hypothetical protein
MKRLLTVAKIILNPEETHHYWMMIQQVKNKVHDKSCKNDIELGEMNQ